MLTETQLACLFVTNQTMLHRQDDGWWRPLNQPGGMPRFENDDVRTLKLCGFVEMVPLGVMITKDGREHLKRKRLIE